MIPRLRLLPAVAFALAGLLSCVGCSGRGSEGTGDTLTNGADSIGLELKESDMTAMAWHKADSLLATMSLARRAGQCFMATLFARGSGRETEQLQYYIDELGVGGVVLLKGDIEGAAAMCRESELSPVPMFMAIDAEWGLGMRLADAPSFPRNGDLADATDEQLMFDYGAEVAREARRIGINMVLGPVVDVVSGAGGVIGSRSFGGDPVKVAEMGVAYALGLESGGVMSVAKHFPGHGSPEGDSHRVLPVIRRSLHQLDSIDLYPFRRYVDAGLSAVMVGHLSVPAIDPEGLPAAVSPVVIQDLLRGELGFRGLVLTDALNMGGVKGYGGVSAIAAGADIVIGPADTAAEVAAVVRAVESGELSDSLLADRCRRILFYKELGLLAISEQGGIALGNLREDVRRGSEHVRRLLEGEGGD